jgi:hypothetical protein
MKNIKYLYLIVLAGFIFSSCQEWIDFKDPEIEHNSAWPITGEWYVGEYYGGEFGYGPYSMDLYNSSFSEDSIWIDNIYDSGIKVKARKTGTNTFALTGGVDVNGALPGDWTVDIIDGQIFPKTDEPDSIYMQVVITMDDGTVYDDYWEAGYRKTGFEGILD